MTVRTCLAVAVTLLALPSAVAAQDPPLRALSDTASVPNAAAARAELETLKPFACVRVAVDRPSGGMSRQRAVKSARAYVQKLAGKSRYRKLLARKELRKAQTAETLAAGRSPRARLRHWSRCSRPASASRATRCTSSTRARC